MKITCTAKNEIDMFISFLFISSSNFIICNALQILTGLSNQQELDGQGLMTLTGERRGAHRCLWGNLRKRDHLEDQDVGGMVILK